MGTVVLKGPTPRTASIDAIPLVGLFSITYLVHSFNSFREPLFCCGRFVEAPISCTCCPPSSSLIRRTRPTCRTSGQARVACHLSRVCVVFHSSSAALQYKVENASDLAATWVVARCSRFFFTCTQRCFVVAASLRRSSCSELVYVRLLRES